MWWGFILLSLDIGMEDAKFCEIPWEFKVAQWSYIAASKWFNGVKPVKECKTLLSVLQCKSLQKEWHFSDLAEALEALTF